MSLEIEDILKHEEPEPKLYAYGFFPIDPPGCECYKKITDYQEKLAVLNMEQVNERLDTDKYMECPRDKTGMNRYQIKCRVCKEIVGYTWAKDKTLMDWCDFHYVSWCDENGWKGCYTPNISPIDMHLGLECTCGSDTRDFRASIKKSWLEKEKINSVGRKFGTGTSKFMVKKVNSNNIPILKQKLWRK